MSELSSNHVQNTQEYFFIIISSIKSFLFNLELSIQSNSLNSTNSSNKYNNKKYNNKKYTLNKDSNNKNNRALVTKSIRKRFSKKPTFITTSKLYKIVYL